MVPEKEVGSTSDAHSLDESDHEEPEPEKIPERKSRFDRNTSSRSLQQLQSRAHSRGSFAIDVEPQRPEPVPEVLPEPEKVPRAQRRGWFGRYTLIAEVTEPKHYPRRIKWFITFIIAVAAMAAPIGSTIIFPSLIAISQDFHTTETVTNFAVGFYMLSLAIFPLFWSSFSETSGRRPVYIVSFTLLIIFNILSALSTNIAMFILMRILSGGASGSVQVVGAGTLADVWHVRERGKAMGYFYLGPLLGPLIAPLIGGALQLKWGWRAALWFLVLYSVVTWLLLLWILPETLKSTKPIISEEEQQAVAATPANTPLSRTSTGRSVAVGGRRFVKILRRVFVDPFLIIYYLRFPAVAITVYYASITFGSLYVLQVSIQAEFGKAPYNFSSLEVGLAYLSNSTGYFAASIIGGKWSDYIMAREAKKAGRYDERGEPVYRPEDRMRENMWLAAFMYPAALIWYGWTADKGVHWIVPLLANFFFGFGSMLVFGAVTTMLTEFMPKKASSGVALNNLCRNICSCIGGVTAEPILSAIGSGWTFTGLGVIAGASSVIIWAMKHYGPKWRKAMDEKMT